MNNKMFRLNNIKYDDCKVAFFIGYPNYRAFEALSILGPAVDALSYSCRHNKDRFGENPNKRYWP